MIRHASSTLSGVIAACLLVTLSACGGGGGGSTPAPPAPPPPPPPTDTTAPDTSLAGAPSALTNTNSVSFTFTATEAGSTFETRLDGGTFATAVSPVNLSAIADGTHTFEVRARDAAGNLDASPASATWTVDTTPPDTSLAGAPPAQTNVTTASFTFTATEAGSTFETRLDNAPFAAAVSPVNLSAIGDGSHTFQVRARDAAGNLDASPASATWTVDTTPPPNGNEFRVQVDRTNVTFDFVQGTEPASQVIRATWTGTPPAQVNVRAFFQGQGLNQSIPVAVFSTSAIITISADSTLAGGTYTGRLTLAVCADPICTQVVGGTPISIDITANVRTPAFTGPANIAFAYTRGTTPLQSPVTLNVVAGAGAWTATASSPFITLSKTSGNGAGPLNVYFDPAGRDSGLYQGTVTVTGAAGAQSSRVSLQLTTPVITAWVPGASFPFSFTGINGAPLDPSIASVSLNVSDVMPMVVSSNQPWLTVSAAGSSAPGNFTMTVNPAVGPLPSGAYAATLRIEVGNGNFNVIRDVPVTLNLVPATLSLPDSIVLGGRAGRDFSEVVSQISLNTATNAHPWTVSGVPPWVNVSRVNGAVGATGQEIHFEPRRLQSTPGTATATLRFTAQVNGDTLTRNVPLSFNLDTHRLLASETGVSLVTTSSPTWRRLSRTVRIRDNMGFTTAWTASDDASWLTTTTSGTSGGTLVMQANASGLTDGLHLATISIASTDSTVAGPERIRVGLWVQSSAPPATAGAFTGMLDIFNSVESDPIRPYVYTHQSNGPTTSIRTFNVYTGTEILPAIGGVPAGTIDIGVSPDGSTLVAFDRDAGLVTRVNLDTRVAEGTFAAPRENFSLTADQAVIARPNGVEVVLTNGGVTYLAATGERLGYGLFTYFDVTDDQRWVYSGSIRNEIDFTSAGGGTFLYGDYASVDVNLGFSNDTGARADGSRVYVAGASVGGPPYGFRRYDGVNMAPLAPLPNGVAFANNVEVGSDGRVYTSSTNQDANSRNIWVYGPDDTFIGSYLVAQGIDNRGLVVSGDGMIVIVNRGLINPGMERIPIGP